MSLLEGLLLLDKPSGITSYQALSLLKKTFYPNKIGHAGTLDRFATGLLLVLVGSYTKLVDFFMEFEKEYLATLEFGKETDTLDPEGKVIALGPVPTVSTIENQISSFLGTIWQVPPLYSAVHIGGERAYRKARKGKPIELPSRPVFIRSIEIVNYSPPLLTLRVVCGKGTYIRSLARDLGKKCGTVAYLKDLSRLRLGELTVSDALLPSQIDPAHLKKGEELLSSLFPGRVLRILSTWGVSYGKPLAISLFQFVEFSEGPYILVDEKSNLAGVVQYSKGALSYRFVVANTHENT
ncbi:MAG: tRNA pseudouridine(55) synthase TruB [Spirochaetales bacterium]